MKRSNLSRAKIIFQIDYDSLCRFYDVIYMNWKPALFNHTYAMHQTWQAGVGPAKDMYDLSLNPQYSLEIGPGKGALWILLSRHITEIDDFKNNKVSLFFNPAVDCT